jgi:hypothetical protein
LFQLKLKCKSIEAGGKAVVGLSLVALDTDHIKQYVFATDKLKEIRGASSILDKLNREEMDRIVHDADSGAQKIYANGGSGLFLVATDKADEIRQHIHQEFHRKTFGGATVTYVVQEIPDSIKDPEHEDIGDVLELLRYRLREAKNSQVFMRSCDSCGVRYAEVWDKDEGQDPTVQGNRYCKVCYQKRIEDDAIKDSITGNKPGKSSPLWEELFERLGDAGYTLSVGVILAPIKYPFGLLQDLAETTLKLKISDPFSINLYVGMASTARWGLKLKC